LKVYKSGLDRFGATHLAALRNPCLGREPYLRNHCLKGIWNLQNTFAELYHLRLWSVQRGFGRKGKICVVC